MTTESGVAGVVRVWFLIWAMIGEYRAIWPKLWWIIPATIFTVLAQLIEPYAYKQIVDILGQSQNSSDLMAQVTPVVLLWAGSVLIAIVVEFLRDYYCHLRMHYYWATVVARWMQSFLAKNYMFHLSHNNAEKIKIFNRGVEATYDVTQKCILNISKSILLLIWYSGLIVWTSWQLAVALLCIAPILLLWPIYLGNYVHSAQIQVTKLWNKVYSEIGDTITNILVVKLFHRNSHVVIKNGDTVVQAANAQSKLSFIWAFLEALSQGINILLSLLVLAVSLYFFAKGMISLGDVVLFVTVAGKLAVPFLQIESSYRDFVRLAGDYSKYRDVLELSPEPDEGKQEFPIMYENIYCKNLSFTYPETTREVLHWVNITLKRGTKTALIGHTGSGKSTISNLLARFYEPTSGSIQFDDLDIRDIALENYRTQFAAVFQDTTLFNDTLRMNLQFVRDGITDDQVIVACRDANVLDFIESLPDGFDTIVGERGLKLSGGEKQRIAIARAILADPEILILDEATSALDAKTEHLVSEALERLMEGRTSLIIAHRLSTIQRADTIYILEQWAVTASGDHTNLYQNSPEYREMVDFQRNGFIE